MPPRVQEYNNQYFNRNNGIIFGFRGQNYAPPKTNWTDYEENIEISDWNKDKNMPDIGVKSSNPQFSLFSYDEEGHIHLSFLI